jgi:hypothetical protein
MRAGEERHGLVLLAWEAFMTRLGRRPYPCCVTVEGDRQRVCLELEDPGGGGELMASPDAYQPLGLPPGCRRMSNLEKRIVAAVGEATKDDPRAWVSAEKVAAKLGENHDKGFAAIMTNLADPETGVLVSAPSRGYRLNPPAPGG